MTPAFASWNEFFAMGGYAFFVWLAVVMTVIPLVVLVVHSVMQHRAILRGVAQQRAREARLLCCATAGGCMNIRRKNRLWIACAVLAGLALTIGLVLYALRSNIDLFYTPGEILYGKRETQQMPEVGQRLRVGGMVMPGSVQRDPNSLKVTFTIYDAEGSVDVSYEGILPDLFREGQGVVVQGELEKGNHILAKEVLAKHDENYTPPEVEKAMEANHRRPASVYKDPAS